MADMIPKVIHYCWFGRGEKPELAKRCIESWKKYCPDYKIVEWNEDNFSITNSIPYVQEAYQQKKYAFVTDYVRLFVLFNYGGIYMDTDVEVVRSLDPFLMNKGFSGFESSSYVPTGIMGAEKGLFIIEQLMNDYIDRHFNTSTGELNMTTNCKYITDTFLSNGLVLNNQFQTISDFSLYPSEYFCPFENNTGVLHKTANTAAIHWFSKSWLPKSIQIRTKITRLFHRIFGDNCFDFLKGK